MINVLHLFLVLSLLTGCEAKEQCDQAAVDGCYADQGCDTAEYCALDLVELNGICVCLSDLSCDQIWYHELCDEAPYDAGTCPVCGAD